MRQSALKFCPKGRDNDEKLRLVDDTLWAKKNEPGVYYSKLNKSHKGMKLDANAMQEEWGERTGEEEKAEAILQQTNKITEQTMPTTTLSLRQLFVLPSKQLRHLSAFSSPLSLSLSLAVLPFSSHWQLN